VKKISALLIVLFSSSLQANRLDWIRKICGLKPLPLASEQTQQMGRRAQDHLGIPRWRQSDIYSTNKSTAAYCDDWTGRIWLNSKLEKEASFGRINFLLHHEAVHKKYFDGWYIKTNLAILGYLLAKTYQKKRSGAISLGQSCGLGCLLFLSARVITGFLQKHLGKKAERRADCKGLISTGCELCVLDRCPYAPSSTSEDSYERDCLRKGYISSEECMQIAAQLAGKRCEHHQQTHTE